MRNKHYSSHFNVTEVFPKILTYRQISPNIFLFTNCRMKTTDSLAVGEADLRTPIMNMVN